MVFRAATVGATVREEDGGATNAEETVGEEHRARVAEVPVECYVLCADDQAVGVGVNLWGYNGEKIFRICYDFEDDDDEVLYIYICKWMCKYIRIVWYPFKFF